MTERRAEPVEEQVADLLEDSGRAPGARALLRRLGRHDRALFAAVARLRLPALDRPVRVLSEAANYSRPWFVAAALTAAVGGPRGRRAAAGGVAAIAVTSLVVNQPMKLLGDRARPDRVVAGVPEARWVPMPTSSSFPSGHSASALAFATAVGSLLPTLRFPLGVAATTVAFSRVYTGVHYPGDVLAGAVVGACLGRAAAALTRRVHPAV